MVLFMTVLAVALLPTAPMANAGVEPVLAVDNVFSALNAGQSDTALEMFAEDAVVENLIRDETYLGPDEIGQMLQGKQRDGRRFDIVRVEMAGDTITLDVEISDGGFVWVTETIRAEVEDGKLQTFIVTDSVWIYEKFI
jgi:hypothetical protein